MSPVKHYKRNLSVPRHAGGADWFWTDRAEEGTERKDVGDQAL